MSHIKALDPVLHGSMRGHIDVEGLPWPEDLRLSTQRSQVKDWVQAFTRGRSSSPRN